MKTTKIPVYLINGFLGSGKTTALIKCIEYFKKKNKKTAIILNELGNTNLEKHLFKDESLYELLNGCICCSIQDDLRKVLDEMVVLVNEDKIDVLLVEGTGVANPSEIHFVFETGSFKDRFSIESSICIVDGTKLQSYLSVFSSSKEVRELQREQLESATMIAINKADLLRHEQVEKIKKIIGKMNGSAVIITTSYADGLTDMLEEIMTVSIPFLEETNRKKHHDIKAIKLNKLENISRKKIHNMLKQLDSRLLRAKGIIRDQNDQSWYHFQYSSGRLEWEKLEDDVNVNEGQIILIGTNIHRQDILL